MIMKCRLFHGTDLTPWIDALPIPFKHRNKTIGEVVSVWVQNGYVCGEVDLDDTGLLKSLVDRTPEGVISVRHVEFNI